MTAAVKPLSADGLYVLRSGVKTDWPYVTDSWVKADAWSREAGRMGANYWVSKTKLVERLLGRWDTTLTVAAAPEDEDAILGWSATGPGALVYFVYVRGALRRGGMGRALLGHVKGKVVCTHLPTVRGVKLPKDWSFDPYKNFEPGPG